MDAKQLTGIRLRFLRTERGLTMPDLCDDIERLYGKKIHKGMYSKWENGIHDPAIEFVRILSQYYDESMDFICGLSNVRRHPERENKRFA